MSDSSSPRTVRARLAGRALGVGLALALLAAALAAPAQAATIAVTTTTDVVDPGDGAISLREAFIIASSNEEPDTVNLAPGVEYDLTSCFVGSLPHTQDEDLTLDGNGSSIYQTCFDRGIIENTDPASDLTIVDVALTGGFNSGVALQGAAVQAGGVTTITDSQIAFNNAGPGGTVIDAGDGMLGDAELDITDSEIYSNVGRAIRLSFGSIEVSGATIINNTGAGIELTDGVPLTITGSRIAGNGGVGVSTTGQGSGSATLTDVEIEDNADTGFRCSGCSDVEISGATISGNGTSPGGNGGGGVTIAYDQDEPTDARATTITDSEISGNAATRRGGGIRIGILESVEPTAPPAQLTLDGVTVTGNATTGGLDVDGGGLAVETGGATITGSTIDDNDAGPPGGITSSKGGGVYFREHGALPETSDLTIADSTVSGNTANSQGGGVWAVTGGGVAITDTTLAGNDGPSLSGGALHAAGAAVTLTRSTLADSSAGTGGGVALTAFSGFPVGSLLVLDSTITGNAASFAASGGGGVFVNVGGAGATATVRNSTVSDNESANLGGGIMVMQTSRLVLDHATVAGNEGMSGANVFVAAGTFTAGRSALALPVGASNCDLGGATLSTGFSFADDASCALGATDVEGGVSQLGPLAANGGPTATRLPAVTSPLGGLVPAAQCMLAADQRGTARPQGAGCEAGAAEITESPAADVDDLAAVIDDVDPPRVLRLVLDRDVRQIQRAIERGTVRRACLEVDALVLHARLAALRPLRLITPGEAARIVTSARTLGATLGC